MADIRPDVRCDENTYCCLTSVAEVRCEVRLGLFI
nr:MAG TPA: hypothetical protein [Caudoviricetes sp.]